MSFVYMPKRVSSKAATEPRTTRARPRPQSARERRRESEAFAAEALDPPNQRPNVDPDFEVRFDRCLQSKYQTHRFVASGGRCCEFCGRAWRDCLVKEAR